MNSSDAVAVGHTPIDDFSQCHVGILEHLQTLGALPALLGPALRARQIAADTVAFFRTAVLEHHAEEERGLFPAVLASAGEESEFLPLSRDILGRNSNHMAALGMSLHLRHSVPQAMRRLRGYI